MKNNKTTFKYIPCKIQLEGSAFSSQKTPLKMLVMSIRRLIKR
jgi:hypothetical protein